MPEIPAPMMMASYAALPAVSCPSATAGTALMALCVRGLLRRIEIDLDLRVVRIEEEKLPGAVLGQAAQLVLDAARLELRNHAGEVLARKGHVIDHSLNEVVPGLAADDVEDGIVTAA